MERNHAIGELLSAGASPSAEEVQHLSAMGTFAATMFARHLHGLARPPLEADRASSWAANISGSLGASTATRWTESMGLGGSLLTDTWHGFWQVADRGTRSGYYDLTDADLSVLELQDDEPLEPSVRQAAPRRGRRGSLFGPKVTSRRSGAARRAKLPDTVAFRDGTTVSRQAVEAIEAGGLDLIDQIAPAAWSDPVANVGDDAASFAPVALGDMPAAGPVFDASGRPVRRRSAARRGASLDGLRIDGRTPALAAALTWASGPDGDGAADPVGLAVSSGAVSSLLRGVDAAHVADAPARRPVYGFFDSVEGEFLSLLPESGPVGPTSRPQPAATPAGARASMFAKPAAAAARPAATRPATPAAGRSMRPVGTSLDSIVRTPTAAVAPLTSGVFQPPATTARPLASPAVTAPAVAAPRAGRGSQVSVAERISYTPSGQPKPAVQRSSIGESRTSVRPLVRSSEPVGLSSALASTSDTVAPATGRAVARHAGDFGPTLPLGASLTRAETLAGNVALRQRSTIGSEGFVPMVAGGADAPVPASVGAAFAGEALDGVAWVAMEADEAAPEDRRLPMAAVPAGRRAAMVPAARALDVGRRASAPASQMVPSREAARRGPDVRRDLLTSIPTSGVPTWTAPTVLKSVPLAAGEPFEPIAASTMPGAATPEPASIASGPGRAPMLRSLLAPQVSVSAEPSARAGFGVAAYYGPSFDADRPLLSLGADAAPFEAQAATSAAAPSAAAAMTFTASTPAASAPRAQAQQVQRALQRPVTTARETMAVAPYFAETGPVGQAVRRASGGVWRPVQPTLVRSLDARRDATVPSRVAAQTTATDWSSTAQTALSMAALAPQAREAVARQLRLSGWTEPQLQMLSLASGEQGMAPAASAAPGRAGETPVQRRMTRNLARVLTGNEALTAGPTASAAATAPMGADLPLLERTPDAYFGSLAPERASTGGYGIRDAIGELLSIARSAGASVEPSVMAVAAAPVSEGAVPPTVRQQILAKVQRLEQVARQSVGRPASDEAIGAEAGIGSVAQMPLAAGAALGDVAGPGAGPAAEGPRVGYGRMDVFRELLGLFDGAPAPGESALQRRVGRALAASTRGPAGAERLLRPLARATETARPTTLGERLAEPLTLDPVVAPEVMLSGMADGRLRVDEGGRVGADEIGTLASFAERMEPMAGRAEGADDRTAVQARARKGGRVVGPDRAGSPAVRRLQQVLADRGREVGRPSRAVFDAPATELLSLMDPAGGRAASPAVTRELVGRLMRQLGRRERIAVMSRSESSDFAMAWLDRIDGGRTGLDMGLGDTRADFGQVFVQPGKAAVAAGGTAPRATQARMASDSPVVGASLVDTSRPEARGFDRDRSGLRQVAQAAQTQGRSAERARSGAASAVGKVDWSYVNTGSGASTSHANLGRLASAAMKDSAAGSRVPFPLVAPAVKAVAQSAHRSATSESAPGSSAGMTAESPASSSRSDAGAGGASQAQPELDKKALTRLALELAPKVAAVMRRDVDRRGKWRA